MKASELRIGNICNYKPNRKPTKVDDVLISVCVDFPELFTPIVLTPEILEKAGFVKDGFNCYIRRLKSNLQTTEAYLVFSGDYLYLRHYNGKNRMDDSVVTIWNKDIMKSLYLHKLQNLVYDLENEELEIEL